MSRVLMSPPDVGKLEEDAVVRAMRSGWIAPTGPEVTGFEEEMAERVGVAHAVAMSSGTAALHLAMVGLGVGVGDVVIVPSMTFVASANAVVYTGATPCFVDVLSEDGNLDAELLADAIADLRSNGKRVAAVMSVDLLGKCADYASIGKVCAEAEVPLIEDAAEALGATRSDGRAGSFGVASALSFNGNKVMTTSGGGMLLSQDGDLAAQARFLSTQAREPVAHYEHEHVGYNYRLSNILAALGRAQLDRLDEMIDRRREIRQVYRILLAEIDGVRIFGGGDDVSQNCWLTALVIEPMAAGFTATELRAHLDSRDIESRPLWKPMHMQPVFENAPSYETGVAQELFEHGVTLPSGSVHDRETIGRVSESIDDFVRAFA